jgi:23S rRNA pseudouridine1911/1915/1917 synthase
MTVFIDNEHPFCGKSVLEFIKTLSLSSKMVKYLKYRENGILVGDKRVTVRYVLKCGDVLSLALDDTESSKTATPVCLPLDIIYEDGDIIVVNKSPFMPTHPSHGHHDDTLANALAYYFQSRDIPFVFRPINRLDKNTSGLVIVAKNKIAAGKMTEHMKSKQIKKSYIALLMGQLSSPNETAIHNGEEMGVIDKHLHRTAKSIIVREVCSPDAPDADSAVTYYKIIKSSPECTMVEAFPVTGRTHQLRVHFASLGHPIIGDDLYGESDPFIDRHALHAHTLEFPLPSGDLIKLSAPLPTDIISAKNNYFSEV